MQNDTHFINAQDLKVGQLFWKNCKTLKVVSTTIGKATGTTITVKAKDTYNGKINTFTFGRLLKIQAF